MKISCSLIYPGYKSTSPLAGWLVPFSIGRLPKSYSSAGIHTAEPLHLTWIILLLSGRSFSNTSHVLGAFSLSNFALNSNPPAVILIIFNLLLTIVISYIDVIVVFTNTQILIY